MVCFDVDHQSAQAQARRRWMDYLQIGQGPVITMRVVGGLTNHEDTGVSSGCYNFERW